MAKTLRPIRPNSGVRARYRKRLDDLLEEMHRSVLWWLRAAYRKDEDRIIGEDASPATNLRATMKRLLKQWSDKWDERAEEIVDMFMSDSRRAYEASLISALKAAGYTVKVPRSRALNATIRAATEWNVSLISSIRDDYLGQVESLVLRAATVGRDVPWLEEQLKHRFELSMNKAHFIARDQSNKVNEAINRKELTELGVSHAIWVHVPGMKTSRATHMAMDGKEFNIDEGLYDSDFGDNVLPAELPGCSCVCRAVIPEFGDKWNPAAERGETRYAE